MAKAKQEAPLQFAECRSLGHEWRKGNPIGMDEDYPGFRRPFGSNLMIGIPSHCNNCGTEKVRWIARTGESFTRYAHPEGYERRGEEVLSAKEWRQDYVSRLFAEFEPHTRQAEKPKRLKKAS